MCNMFRLLKENEIQIRVNQVRELKDVVKASYLLYKDARCDMNILDETVGPFNWQKKYSRENANCIVSIYDKEKGQWIDKEDTGTESNTEAEKGLASDSFKRACFNWGIGRELYTAPNIVITLTDKEYYKKTSNNKETIVPTLQLEVSKIEYNENREIAHIEIVDPNGKVRFSTFPEKEENRKKTTENEKAKEEEVKENDVRKDYNRLYTELFKLGYDIGFDERVRKFISDKSGVNFDNNWDELDKSQQAKIVLAMAQMVKTAKAKQRKD